MFTNRPEKLSRARWLWRALLVVLLASPAGCASPQRQVTVPHPPPAVRGVVFSVDGAGQFLASSASLREVVEQTGLPIQVETFDWSHGYLKSGRLAGAAVRIVADQLDHPNALAEGKRLAETVVAFRQEHPDVDVYLFSHSAGVTVVLAAAEQLPPESVQRIIILAPSVAADYDLRPALNSSREGIDVFYSGSDRWVLSFWTNLLGTSDRRRRVAPAGRVGFVPVGNSPQDAALYAKLRQYPWHPSMESIGHAGGHFGSYKQDYLRTFVLDFFKPSTLHQPTPAKLTSLKEELPAPKEGPATREE